MNEQTITCAKCGADLREKFGATPFTCCEGGAEIGPVQKNMIFSGGQKIDFNDHGISGGVVFRGSVILTPSSASGEE